MKTIANALLFLFVLVAAPLLAANTPERPSSPPAISGGAEARHLMTRSPIVPEDPTVDPLAPIFPGAGFDAFGFDDNATVNGGFLFIPPDPIGAAGVDRLIAVVNAGIEARTKTGTLIFRSSLQSFFSAAAGNLGSFSFDPKIIYDHYADRFVVVALEQTDTGYGDPSDESRILLAVSHTASPATATAADWYFHVINAKLTLGAGATWADYPGPRGGRGGHVHHGQPVPLHLERGFLRLPAVDRRQGPRSAASTPAARPRHRSTTPTWARSRASRPRPCPARSCRPAAPDRASAPSC